MDFSVLDNENVKNHMAMLEAAYAAGAPAGAIGHIENQLNQAMRDAQSAQSTPVSSANPSSQSSGGGEVVSSSSLPPASVPPNPWQTAPTYVASTGIKQATPDIVVFDEGTIDPEFLTNAFFEEFGGTELIKISRSDIINGDEVSYNPIKSLSRLRERFNPNNIIAIGAYQQTDTNYGIDLIKRGANEPYFDDDGNMVIEIDYVRSDEIIEVEIATSGTIDMITL